MYVYSYVHSYIMVIMSSPEPVAERLAGSIYPRQRWLLQKKESATHGGRHVDTICGRSGPLSQIRVFTRMPVARVSITIIVETSKRKGPHMNVALDLFQTSGLLRSKLAGVAVKIQLEVIQSACSHSQIVCGSLPVLDANVQHGNHAGSEVGQIIYLGHLS